MLRKSTLILFHVYFISAGPNWWNEIKKKISAKRSTYFTHVRCAHGLITNLVHRVSNGETDGQLIFDSHSGQCFFILCKMATVKSAEFSWPTASDSMASAGSEVNPRDRKCLACPLYWGWCRTGRCRANLHKWGLAWLWPATDHEPHCRHVPINTIWRWTESTLRSGRRRSHMAGIYSDCSTREINK